MIGCVLGDVAVGVLNPFFHLLPSSWGETGDIQSISNADHVRGMKNATEESGARPARKDALEEGYRALRGRAIG